MEQERETTPKFSTDGRSEHAGQHRRSEEVGARGTDARPRAGFVCGYEKVRDSSPVIVQILILGSDATPGRGRPQVPGSSFFMTSYAAIVTFVFASPWSRNQNTTRYSRQHALRSTPIDCCERIVVGLAGCHTRIGVSEATHSVSNAREVSGLSLHTCCG